jgi:hypothetical protein
VLHDCHRFDVYCSLPPKQFSGEHFFKDILDSKDKKNYDAALDEDIMYTVLNSMEFTKASTKEASSCVHAEVGCSIYTIFDEVKKRVEEMRESVGSVDFTLLVHFMCHGEVINGHWQVHDTIQKGKVETKTEYEEREKVVAKLMLLLTRGLFRSILETDASTIVISADSCNSGEAVKNTVLRERDDIISRSKIEPTSKLVFLCATDEEHVALSQRDRFFYTNHLADALRRVVDPKDHLFHPTPSYIDVFLATQNSLMIHHTAMLNPWMQCGDYVLFSSTRLMMDCFVPILLDVQYKLVEDTTGMSGSTHEVVKKTKKVKMYKRDPHTSMESVFGAGAVHGIIAGSTWDLSLWMHKDKGEEEVVVGTIEIEDVHTFHSTFKPIQWLPEATLIKKDGPGEEDGMPLKGAKHIEVLETTYFLIFSPQYIFPQLFLFCRSNTILLNI